MTNMGEENLAGKLILVVDDEPDLRDIVASELEFMGARVQQAANVDDAILFLRNTNVDLIVSDIRMPGSSGMDLLRFVKSRNTDAPPMILITGFADITPQLAFSSGAEAILNKPFKLEDLVHNAFRFTSPIDNRFKEKTVAHGQFEYVFEEKFMDAIKNKRLSLGRGGINLLIPEAGTKCAIGEVHKFKITFIDTILSGAAICRWWSFNEKSQQISIGLEFTLLSSGSYEFLLPMWKSDRVVSFIPYIT